MRMPDVAQSDGHELAPATVLPHFGVAVLRVVQQVQQRQQEYCRPPGAVQEVERVGVQLHLTAALIPHAMH